MLNTPSWRIAIFIMLFGLSANGQTIPQQIATQIIKTDTSITLKSGPKSISAVGVGVSDTSILHILLNAWNATIHNADSGVTYVTQFALGDSLRNFRGVSQIYNYYGTIIHGGDSVKVDTDLIQKKIPYTSENTANKIGSGGTPNSVNYYHSAAINTILSNYALLSTTLAGYGITNAWTKTEADSRYFQAANANTSGNAITLEYFNAHSTPTQTTTLTGDVTGVGVSTVTTTIKTNVSLPGSPTTTTQTAGDNSTKIATTAFATNAVAALTNTVTANYVPYTGATTNVNIGANSLYSTGSVGIGTTSPATPMEVVETATVTPRGITNSQYSNGNNSAQFHLRKSRGTPSSPLTVVSGDVIGRVMYEAFDGSNFLTMADIRAVVAGSVTATRVPTYLSFYTATDAAPSVMTERMRIGAAGDFNYFGTTSGTYTIQPPASITSYTVTPPASVGTTGQVQSISSVASNSATLGWITPVTSVTIAVPIDYTLSQSTITSTGTITMTHATMFTITDGANFVYNGNNGNIQQVTLGAARTFTITNLIAGIVYNFWVTHGTSTTLTWGTTVKSEWNTAGVPPQSTPNGAKDLYMLRYDGTNINVESHLNIN